MTSPALKALEDYRLPAELEAELKARIRRALAGPSDKAVLVVLVHLRLAAGVYEHDRDSIQELFAPLARHGQRVGQRVVKRVAALQDELRALEQRGAEIYLLGAILHHQGTRDTVGEGLDLGRFGRDLAQLHRAAATMAKHGKRRRGGQPTPDYQQMLHVNVAVILQDAGIRMTAGRDGPFAHILAYMYEALGLPPHDEPIKVLTQTIHELKHRPWTFSNFEIAVRGIHATRAPGIMLVRNEAPR